MSVTPIDQPIQTLRESTIDQLIMNYGYGKISMEAFERRLDSALDATDHAQLLALTEDLELAVDQHFIEKKKEELGVDYKHPDAKDIDYIFQIFGGGNHNGDWTAAREIRIFSFCGGGTLDFTNAKFSAESTTIKIYCLMGGVEIIVPEGTQVNSRTINPLGGFSNRVPRTATTKKNTPNINGVIVMGGAAVKVRRSFKENLMEVCESVRKSFCGTTPHG